MRFSILASGSSGNTCYIETGKASVLIDAGLSGRETERRLGLLGKSARNLDALIITHEHSDHIKGAGPLARRFGLPLYINRKTLEKGQRAMGNLPKPVIVRTGQTLTIRDLTVETFTKCHDAADPLGLILSFDGTRMGLVTDLGRSTRLVVDRLRECNALIVEFNHDQEMLEEGPYPLDLKRRIKGPDGHLSNKQAGELVRKICHDNLNYLVLAHLSKTNNNPTKAHKEAKDALGESGITRVNILISEQDTPSPLIQL
ncbi:MAG: MBL fold metallo-hydrolase [Desulfobacteraceae bacterium]|nr:MBL fold metallo-hydrolase [Desulfobacteraceae bacterium]